jgi:hypothetical protein
MKYFSAFMLGSVVGAVAIGALTLAGFLIAWHDMMFTHDTNEAQAWAWFAAGMTSAGAATIGFVLGGIYGVVRARRGASQTA